MKSKVVSIFLVLLVSFSTVIAWADSPFLFVLAPCGKDGRTLPKVTSVQFLFHGVTTPPPPVAKDVAWDNEAVLDLNSGRDSSSGGALAKFIISGNDIYLQSGPAKIRFATISSDCDGPDNKCEQVPDRDWPVCGPILNPNVQVFKEGVKYTSYMKEMLCGPWHLIPKVVQVLSETGTVHITSGSSNFVFSYAIKDVPIGCNTH